MEPPPNKDEERFMSKWIRYRGDSDIMRKIPPRRIVLYPEIFEKAWGWERLLPYQFGPVPFYLDYLKQYHRRNDMDYVAAADNNSNPKDWPLKARPAHDVTKCSRNGKNALAAAAKFCLDMEQKLMLEWEDPPVPNVKLLSQKIQERARFIFFMGQEFSETAAASLVCMANEAVLVHELLERGAEAIDHEINVCNYIRQCALSLMDVDGPHSDASVSAMVGVAKEAKRMCEWMERVDELYEYESYPLFHDVGLCDTIRLATLDVMEYILSSFRGKPYVLMDFGKNSNKSKSQKTITGTLNSSLSQVCENQDLLREQSKERAGARMERDNSEAERAQNTEQNPDIQEHLPGKNKQDPALLKISCLHRSCSFC